MNSITCECPHCHEIIAGDESLYDQRVKCRKCGATILVPPTPASTEPQTARVIQQPAASAPIAQDATSQENDIFKLSPVARAFPGRILLGVIVIALVKYCSYRLTTQRLFVRRGWLAKHVNELELYRVKDVVVDQGSLQRLLGYGTITVLAEDDSTPEVELARVSRPTRVKELIRTHYRAARQREGVHPTEFMESPSTAQEKQHE